MPSSIYTDILTDKRLTIFTDTNTGLKTYTDTFTDTYICMILIYQYLPIFRKGENIQNTSLAAPGALANCLQRHTAWKIQNGRQGAPRWLTGSEKVSIPNFFLRSCQLLLTRFYDPSTPSMGKSDDGGEEKYGKTTQKTFTCIF